MNSEEKKSFSLRKRIASSNHAFRGVGLLFRDGHNVWLYSFFLIAGIYLGVTLHISNIEWSIIVFVLALILCLEGVNTAIEIDIDLTSPEYHPYARDTKDVAAGAVLIALFFGGIIGALIFLPKVFALFY